ncbi:hypothetical protein GCM10009844_00560 [Nocardioides koreensis]|uniref:Uncharacterized protein n=1 Tax=Nocardioides koreensis TaxID=433651 RepID=A0ABP5KP57_9ACTN
MRRETFASIAKDQLGWEIGAGRHAEEGGDRAVLARGAQLQRVAEVSGQADDDGDVVGGGFGVHAGLSQ